MRPALHNTLQEGQIMAPTTPPDSAATAVPLRRHTGIRVGAATLLLAALLAGCAVELENTRASQEVARMAEPPGSLYLGWRVFENKCAACHGPSATGTAKGPDLLPRVRDMGSRQFVNVVLQRYDLNQAATQARGNDAAFETLLDQIVRRQEYPLQMPAMDGEPSVNAHVTDLYAYLSARASGTQGPGRPAP